MTMFRRGGWRQRVAREAAAGQAASSRDAPAATPQKPSVLVDRVLELWSWGEVSAGTVQYILEGAVIDGCDHPDAVALSRIGSSGRWQNNCHRDIAAHFLEDITIPRPYVVSDVPAFDTRKPLEGDVLVDVELLLPHQLFSLLAETYPKHFSTFTLNDNLHEFWDNAEGVGDPQLVGHPMQAKANWKNKAVPILLYGDGAKFAKRNSLEIVTWSPLLSRASTWSTKFAMGAFVKSAESQSSAVGTWATLWRVLVWSLDALFSGSHPMMDHKGDPFPPGSYGDLKKGQPLSANGYFGVVHRIVGDLEWLRGQLGLRLAPGGNQPCCWCEGNRTTHPFLDLRPAAAWMGTIRTPPCPAPTAHPIWSISGVQLFTVMVDLMHTADLGILQHFIGCCLYTWVYHSQLEGSVSEKLALLWSRVRELYGTLRSSTRLTHLPLSLFCDPARPHRAFPHLAAKAAETRCLLPVILALCNDLHDGSPQAQARLECAVQLSRYFEVFTGAGCHLTGLEHRTATTAMWAFLEGYSRLSHDSATRGILCWNIVNKHHMLVHLTAQAAHLNPEISWTYPLEDLVGRMQRVAAKSKSGLAPMSLSHSIFLKYRRVLFRACERVNA